MNKYLIAAALYILGVIFTFGHAYNQVPDTEQAILIGGIEYTQRNGPGYKTFGAFWAAIVFPFYWSVQAQK